MGEATEFFPGKKPTVASLKWAASVVASRSFGSIAMGNVLAPFADALNHSCKRPHTRMRDCGNFLSFWAERDICAGEEVLNCYGESGNFQWLLNGGFVEADNPFDEVLLTPEEVIGAVQESLGKSPTQDSRGPSRGLPVPLHGPEEDGLFCLRRGYKLPREMVSFLFRIMGKEKALSRVRQRVRKGSALGTASKRRKRSSCLDATSQILRKPMLRLARRTTARYETSLSQDESALRALGEDSNKSSGDATAAKHAMCLTEGQQATLCEVLPDHDLKGVRVMNLRNVLVLRSEQKRILQELEHEIWRARLRSWKRRMRWQQQRRAACLRAQGLTAKPAEVLIVGAVKKVCDTLCS